MQQLIKATLENNNLLLLTFAKDWAQEDITQLATSIFSQLSNANILEHVEGADREYYRFVFNNSYLILHFECYSNACWIEAEDQLTTDAINSIATTLVTSSA